MHTLIEIYDDRSIENVLGPETFRPEQVIYLCPPEIAADTLRQEKWRRYFAHRRCPLSLYFVRISQYNTEHIFQQLHKIRERFPDCAVDITGGTDAALFAAGMFCRETGTPAFTYSRKQNCFYNISHAEFGGELPCRLQYTVEDFFLMAGGSLKKGRVDNTILKDYLSSFDDFFRLFFQNHRSWADHTLFIQRISQNSRGETAPLTIQGKYEQKGEHGSTVQANAGILKGLENIGFITGLSITPGENVRFTFKDAQIRTWMRDVGSVLELYMYKLCLDSRLFNDVISSAIVDWDDETDRSRVSNEIDVVAVRGVIPVFISCKTCEIKTEALNELAILRDRFGGKGAKGIIVTTEYCNAACRHRAAQLGITVIDHEELVSEKNVLQRLHIILKA